MANREIVDAPVHAPDKASLFEDFIDILTSPSKVFARRANANFWVMTLILTVLFGLLAFAGRATFETLMEAEFQRGAAAMMEQNPGMTEEQLATGRRMGTMFGMLAMYAGTPLLVLIVGLIAWIAAKVVGAGITYGQAALIVAYAQVPRLIGTILFVVQGMLMEPAAGSAFASYSISPARFLDPATASAGLMQLMMRFDVFLIWSVILCGIGIAVIGKVPKEKGYVAAGIVWLVGSLGAIWAVLTA